MCSRPHWAGTASWSHRAHSLSTGVRVCSTMPWYVLSTPGSCLNGSWRAGTAARGASPLISQHCGCCHHWCPHPRTKQPWYPLSNVTHTSDQPKGHSSEVRSAPFKHSSYPWGSYRARQAGEQGIYKYVGCFCHFGDAGTRRGGPRHLDSCSRCRKMCGLILCTCLS